MKLTRRGSQLPRCMPCSWPLFTMLEYFTSALVLDNFQIGDLDRGIFLFTKDFGKIFAKVKSASKITSKLNGHLQVGNFVDARLICRREEGDFYQLVDCISTESVFNSQCDSSNRRLIINKFLRLMNSLAQANSAEPVLWKFIISNKNELDADSARKQIFKILGFDLDKERCYSCYTSDIRLMDLSSASFICRNCYEGLPRNNGNIFNKSKECIEIF